jgi:hypothetical protein
VTVDDEDDDVQEIDRNERKRQAGGGGGAPADHATPKKTITQADPSDGDWPCSQCTYVNHPALPTCEICASLRSSSAHVPSPSCMPPPVAPLEFISCSS